MLLVRLLTALQSNERGQTAAEYLGVVVAIGALIGGLALTDVGTAIKDAILDAVKGLTDK